MQINCAAYGCMACCKRYWITVLPREAKKTAVFLNEPLESFLQNHCRFQLQLFPSPKKVENPLLVPFQQIPKEFQEKIAAQLGKPFPYFLVLPTVVFNRKTNGSCEFLNEQNGLCGIYPVRPGPCQLFPFIPSNHLPLHELYPFCEFVQDKKPVGLYERNGKTQFKKTEAYFKKVEKKGFENVWKTIPANGIVRLESRVIGKISKNSLASFLAQPLQAKTARKAIAGP